MTLLEMIVKGGPMMIPLLVESVLTVGVLVDRWLAFRANARVEARSLRAKVLRLLKQGQVKEAALLCANTPGPVSAVLLAGLQAYLKHKSPERSPESLRALVEDAMEDYSFHAMSAVEKRLSILTTVGNSAPLLGMTGTVTGMIASFESLKQGVTSEGVSAGISEALITTAAGLIIALAAVIPYNVFNSQAGRIQLEIQEATTEVLDFVAIHG